MNSENLQVQELCMNFIQAYWVERAPKEVLSYLAEDACCIGIGQFGMAKDKAAFARLLLAEVKRNPHPFEIKWGECKVIQLDCHGYYVLSSLVISAPGEDFSMGMRIICIIKENQAQELQIYSAYTYAGLDLQEGDGHPFSWGEQIIGGFGQGALDFCAHVLPGGVMGRYLEKGFPLYHINEQMLSYLGYTRKEFMAAIDGLVIHCIHPADQEQVCRGIEEQLQNTDNFEMQYRLLKKDGSFLWVWEKGWRIVAPGKRPVIMGICLDITHVVVLQQQQEENTLLLQNKKRELDEITRNVPSGVMKCTCDEFCRFLYLSDSFCNIVGYTQEELVGPLVRNSFYTLVHEEDQAELRQEIERASIFKGQQFTWEYRMKRKDGTIIWVSDTSQILEENGEIYCYCVVTDITQRKEADEKLEALMTNIPGGVCWVRFDENFTLLYGNDSFYELYGYTPLQMKLELGNCLIAAIYQEDILVIIKAIQRALDQGKPGFEFEKRVYRRDGEMLWLLTKGNFMWEKDGITLQCVVIDITDRKAMEEELRINEERFRIALEQTTNIVFDYHFPSQELVYSKQAIQIYQLPRIMQNAPDSLIQQGIIHPDYVEAFLAMFTQIRQGKPTASCVFQSINAAGQYLWNRIVLTGIQDDQGNPVRAIGLVEDITLQREAEIAYLKEEQYRQAILSDALAYAEVNISQDELEKSGGSWEDLYPQPYSHSYTQFINLEAEKLTYPEDYTNFLDMFLPSGMLAQFEQGIAEIKCEHRRLNAEGKMIWMLMIMHMIKDVVTKDIKGIAYLKDIDKDKKEQLIMQYHSKRDSLTGLYNKGATERLIRSFLDSQHNNGYNAFFIVDIDRFKEINDTFGHLFGDHILAEMAQKLKAFFRHGDIIGRIGGDEFVVFMKNAYHPTIVEEKAQGICDLFHRCYGNQHTLSCSIGIAFSPMDGITFEGLYQSADIALYEAKERGRNQYVLYHPSMKQDDWIPYSNTRIEKVLEEDEQAEAGIASLDLFASDMDDDSREKAALMDELQDILYVSDPFTYELLYANAVVREQMGFMHHDYVGQKCYKALQGLDAPCPFCTNALLNFDEYYVWHHTNKLIQRQFILKDRLIWWKGKPARLEYAMDITDQQYISKALLDKLESGTILLQCIRSIVTAATAKEAVQVALAAVGDFYQAERAFIIAFDQEQSKCDMVYEWCNKGFASQVDSWLKLKFYLRDFWMNALQKKEPFILANVEDLRQYSPNEYNRLKEWNIRSIFAMPFASLDTASGYLVMMNTTLRQQELSFLETINYFLINELTKRQLHEKFEFVSYHDPLTGLPNRNCYVQYLNELNKKALTSIGIVIADINGLKHINERFGYPLGDQVVQQTAQILQEQFALQKIFRLGGDEFIVLCEDLSRVTFTQKVQQVKSLFDERPDNGVSLGYTWTEKNEEIPVLVNHANELLCIAKQQYYETAEAVSKHYRPKILKELLNDIRDGQYHVYFQPKADMTTGSIIGAEALVRRIHPKHGLIGPNKFIPSLEKERLIRFIDLFIFEEVCKTLANWQKKGYPLLPVSLNFSRVTLLEKDLVGSLSMIREKYRVDSQWIEIEITESIGEMEREVIAEISANFKQEGFHISLDDFGSKYTSISMLTVMDFDVLKLDRSLVENLVHNQDNQTVVRYVIEMCRKMKIKTIAEGVETEKQHLMLQQLGCDQAQGYLYSKPIPVTEFESFAFMSQ